MATTIQTPGYDHRRTDNGWLVDPRGIVVDWSRNISRAGERPPVDDDLIILAKSMLPKDKGGRGQLQPIVCRTLHDRRVEIVMGFRRLAAALWLVENGYEFNILFSVRKVNDSEAALDNMIENLDRLTPKPIQLAHAIRALRDSYGYTQAQLAERFNRSRGWVCDLENLVTLPDKIQAAVKDGKADVSAAIELARMPAPTQIAVFDSVAASNGKVTATAVKAAKAKARDEAKDAADANGTPPPANDKPTPRNYRRDLAPLLHDLAVPGENENGIKLAKALAAFMAGELTEKKFLAAWTLQFPVPRNGK